MTTDIKTDTPYFPWRGWAFCALGHRPEGRRLFADHVETACARASDYGMNLLEFHDYTYRGGLVDAVISYRDFARLDSPLSKAQRAANYRAIKSLAGRAKEKGLEVNAWYHVFRDAPPDLAARYPEVADVDCPFVWDFIERSIDEFLTRLPEVDRLTITSLHETPSIMGSGGTLSSTERLLKLYQTLYTACRSHGKGLVIRDFIVKGQDLQRFWTILDRLPEDVVIMTKEVLADWRHIGLPLSPNLSRYAGRAFVVEMDLYGEYQGRVTVPWCHPEYVHHVLRNLIPFKPLGVTARIVHDDRRPEPYRTVFESPNEVNLRALGTFLQDPGPVLGGENRWHSDYGQMDAAFWRDWAEDKYGAAAAPAVMRALRRTPRMVELTYDLAGTTYQHHSRYPSPEDAEGQARTLATGAWTAAANAGLDARLERVGMDILLDEKREALHLVERALADIRGAQSALRPADYRSLIDLFEGARLVIEGYLAHLETWGLTRANPAHPAAAKTEFRSARRSARAVIRKMRKRFGDGFFGHTPERLERLVAASETRAKTAFVDV